MVLFVGDQAGEEQKMTETHKFTSAIDLRNFLRAGRAIITLQSAITGNHYTYRIRKADGERPCWFVSLLTGPENETSYTYIGIITHDAEDFKLTAKSRLPQEALPVAGFAFMWRWVKTDHLPPKMTIRHNGHCGRCGRTLTVPASIDSGIGPECARQLGR
jgi:hypothetical protein